MILEHLHASGSLLLTSVERFEDMDVFLNFQLCPGFKLICRQAEPSLTLLLHYKVCYSVLENLQAFITEMKMSNFFQRMPYSQGCRREFLGTQGSCEPTSQFLWISPSVRPSPRLYPWLHFSFERPLCEISERQEVWWICRPDVGLALSEMEHHPSTAGGSKSSAAFPTGTFLVYYAANFL